MSHVTLAPRVRAGASPRLVVVLGLLAILGPLTIDLYLPAFPQMQGDLQTSPANIQLTLSAATLGFALGQLVIGSWSDSIGRRRPLLVATLLHVIASVGIAAAPDVTWVLIFRVLQGAGAAGGGVVAMAMMRDVAEGRQLIRGLSRLALFTGIAPVVAPFLGAQLMGALNWRGLFVIVALYGLAILVVSVALLPESLSVERRFNRSDRGAVWRSYRLLLKDRSFVGIALIGGCMVSSVFAYLSTSSFLFQQQYGLTAQQYGVISAINAIAFVIGTQISGFVAQRVAPQRVLGVVVAALALTGFALALIGVWSTELAPVVAIMLVFLAFAGACGPCLGALALADHADRAGTAAALLGAANFGLAGIAAPLVGALGITTVVPLGVVMGCAMTIATVALWLMVARPTRTVR